MADFSFDQILSGSLMSEVALDGLNDIDVTIGGGTTTTLAGENTVHADATLTLEPVTLNPVSGTADITLAPLSTSSSVDLAPVAVDSCVRLELAPLPPTEIRTPYRQRWAVSVLGVELWALSVDGETSTGIRPAPRRPVVQGRDEHPSPHPGPRPAPAPIVVEL